MSKPAARIKVNNPEEAVWRLFVSSRPNTQVPETRLSRKSSTMPPRIPNNLFRCSAKPWTSVRKLLVQSTSGSEDSIAESFSWPAVAHFQSNTPGNSQLLAVMISDTNTGSFRQQSGYISVHTPPRGRVAQLGPYTVRYIGRGYLPEWERERMLTTFIRAHSRSSSTGLDRSAHPSGLGVQTTSGTN